MDAGTILSTYGLAGLVIFAEASVIIYLYKKVEALTNKLFDLQEKRLQEAKDTAASLNATMTTFSQATSMLTDKIVDVQQGRRR